MEALLNTIAQHMSDIFWALVSAGALGLAAWAAKHVAANKKENDQERKVLKDGMLWIQHDILLKQCKFHLQEKQIDVESLENIEGLYKSYKALGGNGTITKLYKRVQELEIVDDDGYE